MGKNIVNYKERDRVLITGASGFVGSAIVRTFLNAGFGVRVLVRPSSPRENFAGLPVEIVKGDLKDQPSIAAALKDVRYLVHAAADYRLWTRKPSELMAANVAGTRSIMDEALKSGVEKIVYTRSVCTLAPLPRIRPKRSTPMTAMTPIIPTSAARSWPKMWCEASSPRRGFPR